MPDEPLAVLVTYEDVVRDFNRWAEQNGREIRMSYVGGRDVLRFSFIDHDQTDLGASDDRPLGPDHPLYQAH